MVWHLQARIPFAFAISLIGAIPVFAESVDSKIQDGISQYHEGQFKEAGENFSSAQTERPEDSRLGYNRGNAYYKDKNFPEALKAFTHSSLSEKDPGIIKNSIYNTGNTLVKLGKLEEAEAAYKKVLSLDAGDMDAKYNLEYVREQLKKKEEQKQDSDKNEQKDENEEDSSSENKQGGNQEEDKEGDQQKDNQQPPSPPDNPESGQNETDPAQQAEESTMEADISQEEAERMLKNLTEDLKNISRMQAGKTKSAYQGNDW
jgi:Ca-activated chloride channel homolog